MPPRPKKHHYVPVFYLAGFTPSGNSDDRLWVHDLKARKSWESKPSACAFENEFYTVEGGQVAPDILEKDFARFEGETAIVIREIARTRTLPGPDGMNTLLNFVALMNARGPNPRNQYSKFTSEIMRSCMLILAADRRGWDSMIAHAREEGVDTTGWDYDKLAPFVRSGAYTLDLDQNSKLRPLLDSIDIVLPTLARRNWFLLETESPDSTFACSDEPVTISWTRPVGANQLPGFGHLHSVVNMPISKHLMLAGTHGEMPISSKLGKDQVAELNMILLTRCVRFVFTPEKGTPVIAQDGSVKGITDVIEAAGPPDEDESEDD